MSRRGRAWACAALLIACGEEPDADESGAPVEVTVGENEARVILAVPTRLGVPAFPSGSPPSVEKIALGRLSFYDRRLAGNGTQSYGTCHLQRLAFADDKRTPTGSASRVLSS